MRLSGFSLLALAACNGSNAAPPAARAPHVDTGTATSASASASVHVAPGARPAGAALPAASAEPAPSTVPAVVKEEPPPAPEGMLLVPGGTFTMGADGVGEEDERPAHAVTAAGLFLDKTEVTNAAYRECAKAGACKGPSDRPSSQTKTEWFRRANQPVVGVTWFDAKDYCAFRGKRLPTEAEWELAARGLDGRTFPWGEAPPDPAKHGVFGRSLGAPGGTTDEVGSHPEGAGPYGHLDLSGNVWEWVNDEYDPHAYRRDGAPRGIPGTCEQILETQDTLRKNKQQGFTGTNPIPTVCERVLRGGAFNYPAKGLRASNRVHHPASWRLVMAGFRCARDLAPARSDDRVAP